MSSLSDAAPTKQHDQPREAKRLLWGTWPPRAGTAERPKGAEDAPMQRGTSSHPDDAVTAPDALTNDHLAATNGRIRPLPPDRSPSVLISEAPTSAELLEVGSLVGGRYVVEEHISSGGFGAVYRASDREIGHHQVALKLLHHRCASETERQQALRELRLLATVTHPSVVQFKEYGWHEGRFWFAMPWYRGQTLDRMIGDVHSPQPMSRAEARPLFTRLAHGLAAMHAVGVHHHDIKPENIFVAEIAGFPAGLPVLLDLGIATQRGEHPIGLTVEYASPETAAAMLGDANRVIGGAADVYSLALVLRNALDPRLAIPGSPSAMKPRLRERATEPATLSSKRELAFLTPHFRRWLSDDPNKRPTAAELAEEFAILTEPEETRERRFRFAQRILPALMLLGLLVTALAYQLKRKQAALVVQGRELAQQKRVGQALRKQAAVQLDQLDQSAKKLGDERKLLNKTLVFARSLNEQLSDVTRRLEDLERRHGEITTQRDGLVQERDHLAAEKADLTEAQRALAQERDRLRTDITRVQLERDEAALERSKLAAEQARMNTQLRVYEERIEVLSSERAHLNRLLTQKKQRPRAGKARRRLARNQPKRKPPMHRSTGLRPQARRR